jgi:hypothetical protein
MFPRQTNKTETLEIGAPSSAMLDQEPVLPVNIQELYKMTVKVLNATARCASQPRLKLQLPANSNLLALSLSIKNLKRDPCVDHTKGLLSANGAPGFAMQ